MKKNLISISLLTLLFLSQFAFASVDLTGKYTGALWNSTGKSLALKQNGLYATEILVINNTPYSFTVEVPYTQVRDWLPSNRVYRIISNLRFLNTNVRIWSPDYGYMDSFVSSFSIISFSIQYGRLNVITVEYH